MRRRLPPSVWFIAAWVAGFCAYTATIGLPTKRGNVIVWVVLAIIALGADRPRAALRSFVTTWVPLFGALAAYDLLRGVSDGAEADAHTWPHLDVDRWLGGGTTPTEHLQDALWTAGTPHVWDYAAWAVYQSHFLVPLLVAVALWATRSPRTGAYVAGVVVLSWCALATYWLYPAQPPWMVARDGGTGDVARIVHHLWSEVGVDRAARVFTTGSNGSRYSNTVAALPSLHAAFPVLIAVVLHGVRRWLDVVLAAYVVAMGAALVYSGEHFVFDVLLGWLYALVVGVVVVRVAAKLTRRGQKIRMPRMRSDHDDEQS